MESTFKVTVVARIKHGSLHEAIRKRGWTQKKTAEFLGISVDTMCHMINLKHLPKLSRRQKEKLMELTEKSFEDLFPEEVFSREFLERKKVFEITKEVPASLLLEQVHMLQLPSPPDDVLMEKESVSLLTAVLEELPAKDKKLLTERFFENKTLREVGIAFGVTPERIRQRQKRILSKMRERLKSEEVVREP